jgi:hypothetical protein
MLSVRTASEYLSSTLRVFWFSLLCVFARKATFHAKAQSKEKLKARRVGIST